MCFVRNKYNITAAIYNNIYTICFGKQMFLRALKDTMVPVQRNKGTITRHAIIRPIITYGADTWT